MESFSIGLSQVMTAHWKWLGYKSVDTLIKTARASEAGQIEVMVRYIEKAGLTDEVKRRDWASFARGYNGPNYKRYGYDRKIAAAYARLKRGGVKPSPVTGMLKMGA